MSDNNATTDVRNIRTVKDIVGCYLLQHGFGGLHYEDECVCSIDDLFGCSCACDQCEPGHRVETENGWEIRGKR